MTEHTDGDCARELLADPAYDMFRCKPEEWICSCGRSWYHVCDEAEGCFYAAADPQGPLVAEPAAVRCPPSVAGSSS